MGAGVIDGVVVDDYCLLFVVVLCFDFILFLHGQSIIVGLVGKRSWL